MILTTTRAPVRLIHLSPDSDNVDFYVTGGDEWFDDVDFPNASDYKDVDAGSYDLEVRAHDSDTVALTLTGFEIQPGRAYDVIVLGQASDNSLTALTIKTRVCLHAVPYSTMARMKMHAYASFTHQSTLRLLTFTSMIRS